MDTQDSQQLFTEEIALLDKLRAGPVPRPMVIRCVDWSESLIEFGLPVEDDKGILASPKRAATPAVRFIGPAW